MIVRMPSGLQIEARKITGTECIALAERAKSDGGSPIGTILAGTWQTTLDPGPYARFFGEGTAVDWNRILKGDLIYGLIQLRVASVPAGHLYQFAVKCQECGERYEWRIDLTTHLKVKLLSEESRAIQAKDGRFTTYLIDPEDRQRAVTFRLMSSADDEPLKKLMTQLKRTKPSIVESCAGQIIAIEGLKSADLRTNHRFLETLVSGELDLLRYRMNEPDCGYDTEIQTQHGGDCGWTQDIDLPFRATFFRQPVELLVEKGIVKEPTTEETSGTATPG